MEKAKKDYYLMEQMRGIQKELGIENDGRENLIKIFEDRVSKLSLPAAVKSVYQEVRVYQTAIILVAFHFFYSTISYSF
jgi:ATP-dependent Lon protease